MNSPQPPDVWLGRSIGDTVSVDRSSNQQRYRIDQRLGGGGMGDVFLATDTLLDRLVALKLLSDKLSTGELRQRFEREVAVSAALTSAHIVHVSDYGVTADGYPFYVMEYLQGQTLGQLLEREQRLSTERAAVIIAQVCAGLQLAHGGISLRQSGGSTSERVKVVHRDLKPDNIFLVPTAIGDLVKILDFGIAKLRTDQTERINATTVFLGTYRYAAPEQFDVGQDLDERADIYSLGLMLYEMLTGTDPFGFRNTDHQLTGVAWGVAHLSKPAIALREQPDCTNLSSALEAVVMQCLAKAPEQRFASVVALSQALHAAVPEIGDRGLLVASIEAAPPITNPPPIPTRITPKSPPQTTRGSMTQNVGRSIAATAHGSENVSKRSGFLNKPVLLMAGTAIAVALGLGIYYSSQSFALFITPPATPIPSDPASPQPPIQQEASVLPIATKSLTGHSDTVWTVAIDPARQILASGSFDKTIRLWNLQTGTLLRTLSGHTNAVRAVAISADGTILASGSGDKTIKLWSLPTGKLLRTLIGHSGPVWSVAISSDGKTLASGSYDGTIKLWNLQTGDLQRTLPDHYDSVWSVAISSDGKTLASGSYDGTIKLWNLQTGQVLHSLSDHTDTVRSVAISPNGKTLISGSWDKTIKLWDVQTGALLRTLSGHADRVLSVAISPDGRTIASSSVDRTVRLWDAQTGKPLRTFSGHTDWVTSVAFSADSQTLASGSKDKTIKLWRREVLTDLSR